MYSQGNLLEKNHNIYKRVLILEENLKDQNCHNFMLFKEDFPENWENFFPPDDLILKNPNEIEPFNQIVGPYNRFLYRLKIQSSKHEGKVFGVTFLLDLCAPYSLYLGADAWRVLEKDGSLYKIRFNPKLGDDAKLKINNTVFNVMRTPQDHDNANLFGARAFMMSKFQIDYGKFTLEIK